MKTIQAPSGRIVQDMTGHVVGRLTATRIAYCKNGVFWLCRCECGNDAIYSVSALRSGKTISCGCFRDDQLRRRALRHGKHNSTEYLIWRGMLSRCQNPTSSSYARYGARGISVCATWASSFEVFFADMGERPPRTTLDRRDNNKGYDPSNCRWATAIEQSRNRRNNRVLEFGGESLCVSEWAERVGISAPALFHRLRVGWPLEVALTTPASATRRAGQLARHARGFDGIVRERT